MNGKWKSGKLILLPVMAIFLPVLTGIATILLISSCNNKDEHNHIPTNKISELDGLAQPTNQTVFSEVKTVTCIQQSIKLNINATGVISYDPRLLNNISARYDGRIEKLYVRFNFENVYKGQRIMDIYSPDILTAQQNLVFLLNNSSNDTTLVNLSIQKLKLFGFTNEQLKQLETSKIPINPIPIFSPYNGHIHDIGTGTGVASPSPSPNNGMNSAMNNSITPASQMQIENIPSSQNSALTIKEGMYVESGQKIFAVYNTNQVWAILNIFPGDAAFVKTGNLVSITTESNPANVISSTISYIEPVTGQNASSIKARVYLQNADNLHMKIGTLLAAKISSSEINGIWLPRNTVVNLGQKQIVFLKTENYFTAKIIHTGIETDSLVQIVSGLIGGEKVAANGQYMVDSESFIQPGENEK